MAVAVLGVGYTSYNIGFTEGKSDGIRIGAGLMFEKLWAEAKPRKRDPSIRVVELERE